MASLNVTGLNKVYPSGTLALYDINLSADDKEFIVITGGEASGKSTLLRVIAGLESASDGEVSIGGKVVNELDPKDRDLTMIFSGNSLYPSLNVFDNMAYGLRLRKAAPALIEQRVKAAAEILGLNDVLYRKPKVLTASQKQRVTLGRALVREPKLYLLDDPLSGLDDKLRAELLSLFVNMQSRMQGTFVYATKNILEAMSMGTRIVVLKNGMVQQIDTPANLYDYPANVYVAFYCGSPTINLVRKVTLWKEGEGVVAKFEGGTIALTAKTVERLENAEEYINTEKPVILGIRPEDCGVGEQGFATATVSEVEDGYAACDINQTVSFTVKAEGLKKGDKVNVTANNEHVYLFDGVTTLTLLKRDEGYVETGKQDAKFTPLPLPEEKAILEQMKPKKQKKSKK
jgi:multiple sugar transport system ATP-binding protein